MRAYQAEVLKRIFQSDVKYGVFLAPRTGKTKVAIDAASALFSRKKPLKVLVVCQRTGHQVWSSQFRIHCGVPYTLVRLLGSSTERARRLKRLRASNSRMLVVLLNYESTWRIQDALLRWKPDMLIYDEAHKLKNRSSKQSQSAHELVEELNPYRLLLTGSAIANSPLDLFSEFKVIDDSIFGRRWSNFKSRYALSYGYFNRKVKYKNLADLRRKARKRATILTKEECLDLPPVTHQRVPVVLSAKTRKIYEDMDRDFVVWLSENEYASASIKLTQLLRLSQITGGFLRPDDTSNPKQIGSEKLDACEELLEELIEEGEKVVVFARFRAEIDAIEQMCQRRKWKSFKYYGPIKGEREHYPERFQKHKEPAVFIAQTQAGSLSIELNAAAYAIFYSFDFNLVTWEQDHDRIINQPDQSRKVVYLYLIARATRDNDTYRALITKKGVASILNNVVLT